MSTVCETTAITLIPLYQALVLLYLYPALSVPLAWLINNERCGLLEIVGVGVGFVGCALLVWPDQASGLEFNLGHLLSMWAALMFALASVLIRRLKEDNDGLWPLFSYSFFGFVCAWPLAKLLGIPLGFSDLGEFGQGALLGLIGSMAQLISYAALKYLPAFKVGVIGTLEILGGVFAGWLIFHESLTLRALLGGVLVLYAAFGFREKIIKN
jgi:S-adenosylmethionine uptake transporter